MTSAQTFRDFLFFVFVSNESDIIQDTYQAPLVK